MNKIEARVRRATRTRAKIKTLGVDRLTVHRTPRHIYAQIIKRDGSIVVSASSLDKDLRKEQSGNISSAELVGKLIGERAVQAGISKIAFDRSGFKYHGRVKALADKAREAGLTF